MINIAGLTKRYGPILAVDHLSFEAHPQRVTALLGPNGAGKTTTLRMLLGLTHPSAGRAAIDGHRYAELARPIQVVGAVLEESTYHPARTGRAHLQVLAIAAGLSMHRIDDVLADVELTDAADRRVGTYSLGMRQRLGIAVALLGNPGTLVLDEPQNGLDPQGTAWLRALLRRLAAEGRTVLVSSHLLSEVTELADDVVIVRSGRLVHAGPLQDLLSEDETVRVRTPEAGRLAETLREAGIPVRSSDREHLVVNGSAGHVGQVAAAHGIALLELVAQRRRLEDVFIELTDGALQEAR